MVMECNYGGGLFLEIQPLTDCMLCEGVGCPYCRLYCSLWGLGGLCAGWCVDYVLGRVVLFLGFIPKYGVDVGMVVRTILLYVVMCCMFTMSLRCVFISLCRDTFVYGSAILTFVLGAPNICGRCSKSACFKHYCAHQQQVKIVLYSIWYHHTEASEWSKITKIQFYKYEHIVVKFMYELYNSYINDTTCCIIQFWPTDDEYIVLETCRGI
jgi:hypothetical protein